MPNGEKSGSELQELRELANDMEEKKLSKRDTAEQYLENARVILGKHTNQYEVLSTSLGLLDKITGTGTQELKAEIQEVLSKLEKEVSVTIKYIRKAEKFYKEYIHMEQSLAKDYLQYLDMKKKGNLENINEECNKILENIVQSKRSRILEIEQSLKH